MSEIAVGQKLKLLKDIYDDGADNHHPPGYIAFKNEVVIVRSTGRTCLAVSHENVTDKSFLVYAEEYELLTP